MIEFTFIVVTYNHEKYILDHLNSIKMVVEKYANNRRISVIVSDDCSKDRTVAFAKKWLKDNASLFCSTCVIKNNCNQGTVQNILQGINACKTEDFKILAGDDKYYDADVFYIYEEAKEKNKIITTPVIPFGAEDTKCYDFVIEKFKFLLWCYLNGKMRTLMKCNINFATPGTFVAGSFLRTERFKNFISQFKYNDDYPMWYYLYFTENLSVEAKATPYVYYRVGSGISTNKQHAKRSELYTEWNRVHRMFLPRSYLLPKYLNFYKYKLKFYHICTRLSDKRLNKLLSENVDIKKYYCRNNADE